MRRCVAVLVGGGLIVAGAPLVSVPTAVFAATPAPVMTGFVPLGTDATLKTMENVNAAAQNTLVFTVGVTNASTGAVMYYDHWEDGFDADLTNVPVGSTTQVWGDGVTTNGNAAAYCTECTGDLLPAGAVFVMSNDIPSPRTAAIFFDGRDRVSSTRGFTITAGGYSTLGSVLSASASAYDTSRWGTDYWVPVGQGLPAIANTGDPFSTTSLQVMAGSDATTVTVDRTGDGVIDITYTLNTGQIAFVNDNVRAGARVLSTKPVQVHVGAGDRGSAYELRWFSLLPTNLLAADYMNPVGSNSDNQRTITYLFNPATAAISVTASCTGCPGSPLSVPARGTVSLASPLGQGVTFASADAEPFVAVGASGSQSGAAPGSGADGSATFDWGFGLVPTNLLTDTVLLGWAPGNSNRPPTPSLANYGPVWVTTVSSTTVYVDYDGNTSTGTTGPCGLYDSAVPVLANASTRLFDAADGDMTGARVYTCGVKIAGAWGQDPSTASSGAPGFDAGYALVPSTNIVINKSAGVTTDTTGDGQVGPGDVLQYTVTVANVGNLPFNNVTMTDGIPANTSYVVGSTTISTNGATAVAFPDDLSPATPYPFDGTGSAIPQVADGATVTLTYQLQIALTIPANTPSIVNNVAIDSDTTDGTGGVSIPLKSSDLQLTKIVTSAPVYVGDSATFRISVANQGTTAVSGITVLDALPVGLTFVSATPGQGTFDPATGIWSVGSLAAAGTAVLDLVATVDTVSVVNSAEITGADAVDVDSTPGNTSGTEDDEASVTVTAQTITDVALSKTRQSGPDSAGNTTFRLVLGNTGSGSASGVKVTEYPPSGAVFVSATPVTSSVADGTFDGTTNVWSVATVAPGGQAALDVVYRTPVAPTNNYAQVTAANELDRDSTPDTVPLSDSNPPDQDDEASTGIPANGDVSVTNIVTTSPAHVGDTAVFTVTVANAGPTNTTGVSVTDLLPAGLVLVSAVASEGTYDPTSGVWAVGSLAATGSETLVLTARATAPGILRTTAELTGSTAADIDSTPNNHVVGEDDQASNSVATTGATLGNLIWFDVDADGVADAGEPGLAGVEVIATWFGPDGIPNTGDDESFSTTTNASGAWTLTDLPKGDYSVAVTTTTLPGGVTTGTFDIDGLATADVATITLAGGATRNDVDFGYTGSGQIGDMVFHDVNGDDLADTNEGLGSIGVHLVWLGFDGAGGSSADDIEFDTVTVADGSYGFANLPAGDFIISVVTADLPAGLRNSVDPVGADDSSAALSLTVSQDDETMDFGYVGTNSIGDTVFVDIDNDGVQDAGEPGLGGVSLTLTSDTDQNGSYETTVATTLTSGAGTYSFEALPTGDYRVEVSIAAGSTLTTPASVTVSLTNSQTFDSADFGIATPTTPLVSSIGDTVWNDTNGNGLQDPGEVGVADAVVTLRGDADGDGVYDVLATQTTTPTGTYGFANLPVGSYLVSVAVPSGRFPTTPPSRTVPLEAGAAVNTVDFGVGTAPAAPSTLTGLVWDDADVDGTHDVGEPGRSGVTVTVLGDPEGDGTFTTVAATTTTTDGSGNYTVPVAPGEYRVVTSPGALTPTTPIVLPATVAPGATVIGIDFGLTSTAVPASTIGDRVWLDLDRNGIQNPGEPGINDVAVRLVRDNDGNGSYEETVATTTTSGNGGYVFATLPAGLYRVIAIAPSGLGSTNPPPVVALAVGQNVVTADIGLASASQAPYDLEIDIAIPGPAIIGDTVLITVVVTNNSTTTPTPTELTVVNQLPPGLELVSAGGPGWTCTAIGQTVTCVGGGPIPPGGSSTIVIVTRVVSGAGTEVTNTATVSAGGVELSQDNNTDSATLSIAPAPTATTTTVPSTPEPTVTPPSPAPDPTVAPLPPTPPTPPAAGPLPITGTDTTHLLMLALVLCTAGGAIALITRRPSRSTN